MDFAVLTSPVWWMARQWQRFLTGLVIVAVALGPVPVAPAVAGQAAPVPAASVQAASAVAVEAAATVAAQPAGASETGTLIVEPDSRSLAPAPVRASRQRPAQVAGPASVDVSPVGQRAPPAAASAL